MDDDHTIAIYDIPEAIEATKDAKSTKFGL